MSARIMRVDGNVSDFGRALALCKLIADASKKLVRELLEHLADRPRRVGDTKE